MSWKKGTQRAICSRRYVQSQEDPSVRRVLDTVLLVLYGILLRGGRVEGCVPRHSRHRLRFRSNEILAYTQAIKEAYRNANRLHPVLSRNLYTDTAMEISLDPIIHVKGDRASVSPNEEWRLFWTR